MAVQYEVLWDFNDLWFLSSAIFAIKLLKVIFRGSGYFATISPPNPQSISLVSLSSS
jgi:hypothetical protein